MPVLFLKSCFKSDRNLAGKNFFGVLAGLLPCLCLIASSQAKGSEQTEIIRALSIRSQLLEQTDARSFLKPRWTPQTPQALQIPTTETPQTEILRGSPIGFGWKRDIMTTVFWIGESPTENNPTPNNKSSWDTKWEQNFGGYDSPKPEHRIGFRPAGFLPKQNPFYIALPYNDVGKGGTKPEASKVIPWFHRDFVRNGKSVVKGRWIAIHHKGRIAYAQWEDTGPYRTDHWQYVFGNERPTPNRNKAAGLDVSPAVRDYLGMKGNVPTDWKFVEVWEVPRGPWSKYGQNNPLSPYYVHDTEKLRLAAAKTNTNR